MFVIKRSGETEQVNLNKITKSIQIHSSNLSVDPFKIAQKTINGIYDGISTKDIDLLSIQTASSMVIEEPDYSKLAARLLNSVLTKEVESQEIFSFWNSIKKQYEEGLINDKTFKLVKNNIRKINNLVDTTRNDLFEYFGLKTLYDRYLAKNKDGFRLETPQYFWLRVACGISDSVEDVSVFYEMFSTFDVVPSTPTLFNSGTKSAQMSSCYLLDSPDDSIVGIFEQVKDMSVLAKYAGGIGLSYSKVRSQDSYISGINGKSDGIIGWLKVLDSTMNSIRQGGRRRSSACIYLETWHADIEDFLRLRENTGDISKRTYNLNIANWVPDLFMRRVQNDEVWSLFDPKTVPHFTEIYGKDFEAAYREAESQELYVKQVNARELFTKMVKSLAETSHPWMCFKDSVNVKNNQTYLPENVIHSSNLCVTGDTYVLTDKGQYKIKDIDGSKVNVWNGFEWSKVLVKKTGENQDLVKVTLSNGVEIVCTPYHKFITKSGIRVPANELKTSDKLFKEFEFPIITQGKTLHEPYTNGFFTAEGCEYKDKRVLHIYGEKYKLINYLKYQSISKFNGKRATAFINPLILEDKFFVPINYNIDSKLRWLEGLFDGDGTVSRNGENQSLQLSSNQLNFLREVRLLLQTLGIDSKITDLYPEGYRLLPDGKGGKSEYYCLKTYRLLINSISTQKLLQLGFSPKRLLLKSHRPNRDASRFIKVKSIETVSYREDTYCFHEESRGYGIFNGVLTGNCTEITEATNSKEVAVCNLHNINLLNCVENGSFNFNKLSTLAKTAVISLNKVIDKNFYPIPQAETSNQKWRPIGLGFMGLADVFFKLKLSFDSEEARKLSRNISEVIYFSALRQSIDLAKTDGKFENFEATRFSQGILQFDLWNIEPEFYSKKEWKSLKKDLIFYGARNSLLTSIQPTATVASIAGVSECIEPLTSNFFKRETTSGDFLQINNYLIQDLKLLGFWNEQMILKIKESNGSIQNIKEIPDELKLIYRTVWEIPMRSLIDMAAERGAFIDQSQSLNLFVAAPNIGKLSSMYMYAWQKGLKTTYYLRTRPASEIMKTTNTQTEKSETEQLVCSLENPENCESCQ